MCGECGCNERTVDLNLDILRDNKRKAEIIRNILKSENVLGVNIMGSPGSGKTSLIEKTALLYGDTSKFCVIEGDLETDIDNRRLRSIGVNSFQINTGTLCHLDADMMEKAIKKLSLSETRFLFVENVGNLVCPSLFDLGTHINAVLISVAEGEDKPLKYPLIFKKADIILITKIDLLPFIKIDESKLMENLKRINGNAKVIKVSTVTDEGIKDWIETIENLRKSFVPLP